MQWVDRHADYLYRFAVCTVERPETAEDLVQETLLAAWKSRGAFEGRARERSWLTAILRRKMIDHLRSSIRDRRVASESEFDDSADGTFGRLGHWNAAPKSWVRGTPDDAVERAEFWQAVRGCADKLPPRSREAFVLWHLDETPSEGVCEAIGITPDRPVGDAAPGEAEDVAVPFEPLVRRDKTRREGRLTR